MLKSPHRHPGQWAVLYRYPGNSEDHWILCPDHPCAEARRDEFVRLGQFENVRTVPAAYLSHLKSVHPSATLLKPVEVAKVLNIGIRTIWRWADTGVMPAPIRAGVNGRIVRWNRAGIERWVAEGCPDQRRAAS